MPIQRQKAIALGFNGCFAATLGLIAWSLYRWGAREFREDIGRVTVLTMAGGILLMALIGACGWAGISRRDDMIEGNNLAALASLCGATVAFGAIYVGGSLGEGPSYANNFFSFGAGLTGLFLTWAFVESAGKASISICEERDLGSGIRLGGFLIAAGFIFGRAVAGNWHSAGATIMDLIRDGWVMAPLALGAAIIEKLARPTRANPFPNSLSHGLLPAILYLSIAAAWIWRLGPWEDAA